MKVKIFYSWQSSDQDYNKKFIYSCIRAAERKIKKHPDFKNIEFDVTDAIRGEAGQVAIADSIIHKIIPACDIFIADLTANRINWLIRTFTPLKPAPNPNVMTEYGVALNSLGKERIISILNTHNNGSPKDKPEIIPFDLRHDRFPTEYNYSKGNERKKEEIKNELINKLIIALKPAINNVLKTQKSKFRPFIVWNELNELLKEPKPGKFIDSQKFQEIKQSISGISNATSIRILGLSGLGKTRIIYEIFRPISNENNSLIFSNRLLYINCNDYQEKIKFVDLISKISRERKDTILVVDNCDLETHKIITRNIKDLAFISIDSNPEESTNTDGTNYIVIGKNDLSSVVTQLVDTDFQHVAPENLEKIKNFSQGIPLMAVLLAESISKGEKFLGKLDDKELLDKLLGLKGKDSEWRSVLKSCSMFSYIGFENEVDVQFKFIATNQNITISNNSQEVRVSTFLDVVKHFKEREIFEKQGRFLSIRPFPLAMALAVEWLDSCTSERILQVIQDISTLEEPNRKQLINSFSDQMKYLGYNDKAVEIVEKITGPESPFDNAEVLNTELGSRLFRSFVEVNPVAVSKNFHRVFSNKPKQELFKIISGRRNLVWVLEKLCFDKRTFAESAKILYSFAIAENETWANNATGQFLHLFNIHLSGTEADLTERWKIIDWGLNKIDEKYEELAIKAMKVGLNYGQFSRMGGAEKQGNKVLHDNVPTWAEIKDYWSNILSKLLEIIKAKNEFSESASEIITSSIRSFYRSESADLIIPYLKEISEFKGYDWEQCLKGLKQSKKYDKNFISNEVLIETDSLIRALTKTDFSTRYLTLASSHYLESDEDYSSDGVVAAFIALAEEFINTNVSWEETFSSFYKNQQVYSFYFGQRLAELLNGHKAKIDHFIEYSIEVILQIPENERNYTVLRSFIVNSSEKVKHQFYHKIYQSEELRQLLFFFISADNSGSKYFSLLFEMVEKNLCPISSFYTFSFSNTLKPLNLAELTAFSEKLIPFGDEGYAIIFDLFFEVGYGDSSKKTMLLPIIKTCIYKLGYLRRFSRQLDDFKWSEAISSIISDNNEVDFAVFINKSIISSITWENSYHLDHYVQRIYEILMKVHFFSIWNDLSEALISKEEQYSVFYGLKHILGSRIGGTGRNVGVLFEGDIDAIFQWCMENRNTAPARLAELVPIFDNNNSDYSNWHPITLRLLDSFGDIESVLDHLHSNMSTYSWTGSLVPFLEAKRKVFGQLTNHKITLVNEWAISNIDYLEKAIETEKIRDAERFL